MAGFAVLGSAIEGSRRPWQHPPAIQTLLTSKQWHTMGSLLMAAGCGSSPRPSPEAQGRATHVCQALLTSKRHTARVLGVSCYQGNTDGDWCVSTGETPVAPCRRSGVFWVQADGERFWSLLLRGNTDDSPKVSLSVGRQLRENRPCHPAAVPPDESHVLGARCRSTTRHPKFIVIQSVTGIFPAGWRRSVSWPGWVCSGRRFVRSGSTCGRT